MDKKVSVIGAGNVGASTALRLAELGICDVALIDSVGGLAAGKALDLSEAAPIQRYDARIAGSSEYEMTEKSDVVVVTAGFPRKPGMSRDDLLASNAEVVGTAVRQAVRFSPDCILIIVSNPMDAMCHVAMKESGFPRNRVIGMAGILDAARFRTFIAQELGVSMENCEAMVLGAHGDAMVPVPRYSTVAGIPVTELISSERLDAIVERVRSGGAEVVGLLKTGGAYYAPSAAIVEMVEAILKDKKKILPCSAYLEGEYEMKGVFVGVPVKLGKSGIEEIVQIGLLEPESEKLRQSAAAVRKLLEKLKGLS